MIPNLVLQQCLVIIWITDLSGAASGIRGNDGPVPDFTARFLF